MIDDRNFAAHSRNTISTLHRTWRLDNVEYLVWVAADIALTPTISTPGIVAFAARIAEGHRFGASGTVFQFPARVESIDHAAQCNDSCLVAWLMFKAAFQAVR